MKITGERVLAMIGFLLPLTALVIGEKSWGYGLFLGELLGLVSFLWIGWMVRSQFATQVKSGTSRRFLLHSLLRYFLIASVFILVLKSPAISIWAVVIGYSVIQLPAAVLRALLKEGVLHERNSGGG